MRLGIVKYGTIAAYIIINVNKVSATAAAYTAHWKTAHTAVWVIQLFRLASGIIAFQRLLITLRALPASTWLPISSVICGFSLPHCGFDTVELSAGRIVNSIKKRFFISFQCQVEAEIFSINCYAGIVH